VSDPGAKISNTYWFSNILIYSTLSFNSPSFFEALVIIRYKSIITGTNKVKSGGGEKSGKNLLVISFLTISVRNRLNGFPQKPLKI
jgi:hypothetical protein